MKKHSKVQKVTNKPSRTVGIDLGDRCSSYCILNHAQSRGRSGGDWAHQDAGQCLPAAFRR